jgi:TraG P-loop domain
MTSFQIQKITQFPIVEEMDFLKIGEKFVAIYFLTSLPNKLNLQSGNRYFEFSFAYDLFFINQRTNNGLLQEKVLTAKTLSSAFQIMNSQKVRKLKGEKEITDIETIENDLNNQVIYQNLQSYLVVTSESKDSLKSIYKEIKNHNINFGIVFSPAYFQQKVIWEQINGLQHNNQNTVLVPTGVLANLLPSTTNIQGDFPIGINVDDKSVYQFELYPNNKPRHIVITGMIRSGKSTLAKCLIEYYVTAGIQTFVLDPENEFTNLAECVGGSIYDINRSNGINPMYVTSQNKEVINDHILILSEFFAHFSYTGYNRTVIKELLQDFYLKYNQKDYNLNEFLSFVESILVQNPDSVKYDFLRDLLQLKQNSIMGGYFNSKSSFSLHSNLIVFNLKNIEKEEVKKPALYIIADLIKNELFKGDRRRVFVADEFHHLISSNQTIRNYFVNMSLRSGKYNAFMMMITQELAHFLDSGAESLLNQAQTKFLFRQNILNHESIQISKERKEQLMSMPGGHCYLYETGDTFAQEIKVIVPKEQINRYQPKNIDNKTNQNWHL